MYHSCISNSSFLIQGYNNTHISVTKIYFEETLNLDIAPLEEKIIDITKKFDPKTKPSKDNVYMELRYEDKKIDDYTKNFEVVAYSEITDTTDTKKGILTKKNEYGILPHD